MNYGFGNNRGAQWRARLFASFLRRVLPKDNKVKTHYFNFRKSWMVTIIYIGNARTKQEFLECAAMCNSLYKRFV